MDGQEYLNQIAADNRPAKKSKNGGGLLGSPIVKVAGIGLIVLVVIIIVGALIGGGKGGVKKQATELLLHINNTSEMVSEYQGNLKSSTLRSSSASLGSILSNTSRELTAYMVEKYNYKDGSDKKLVEDTKLHQDDLNAELFNAKINGILDRIYAHKMSYEISLITGQESSVYNAANDESLRTIMQTSYDSLKNLYDQFNDFSETK